MFHFAEIWLRYGQWNILTKWTTKQAQFFNQKIVKSNKCKKNRGFQKVMGDESVVIKLKDGYESFELGSETTFLYRLTYP